MTTPSDASGQSAEGLKPPAPIPLCVPEIRGDEWRYVKECLDTAWVSSSGAYVDRFEQMLRDYIGVRQAVATVNGTAALHIALLVAGVAPDDEVLVSTLTFIAPVNAIRYCGAWPVFIDAEPEYWQMDPAKVAEFLETECELRGGETYNKRTGRRIRAILPVHILGHPVELDAILPLARRFGLAAIEDATESLGAKHRGQLVGRQGDIACLSFNGNKMITTGGGGAIVTDNEEWAERARYLTTQAKDDPVEYVHRKVGYNYRLTNLQAAMGCAQLEQLPAFLAAKKRIAARYDEELADVPGIAPMPRAPWVDSACWLYTVAVNEAAAGLDSRALMKQLGRERIQTRPLWQPIHRSPAHAGSQTFDCPVADRLYRTCLSLPSSVGLTADQQTAVIAAIREAAG